MGAFERWVGTVMAEQRFGDGVAVARKTTQNCWDFGEKLDKLYEAFKRRSDDDKRICSDADLIDKLPVGKATIDAWRNGVSHKGRAPWQLASGHIEALAGLLVRVTDDRLTAQEAYRLWIDARRPEFTRRLFNRERIEIAALLAHREPTSFVTCHSLQNGLGMVETNEEPVEGELQLESAELFELRVDTVPGRYLVVLGVGEGGWFLLAPANEYRGPAKRKLELVPRDKRGWRINRFSGPHRVIVIEVDASSAPIVRDRGDPMILSPYQEDLLVEELTDPELARRWRWGECRLFVKPAR